ncbi:hypothetical protein NW754_001004 [Fusarium falciforme]|nr:hypothetical protein NW754_001004 [Fusarium falciforme]
MSSDEAHESTPASPREEDQINEWYWPVLRKILEKDPSGMDRLNLECMICDLPMAEGMPVTPKCGPCTLRDVGRCLTTLTSTFEPKFFGELKSFEVVYQVQVLDFTWGRLAGDERKCVAIDIPDSMHDLCRSIEAKLVALCNIPGQTVKGGGVKIRLFRYSSPLEMDRRFVRRITQPITAPRQTANDQTTDETRQSM